MILLALCALYCLGPPIHDTPKFLPTRCMAWGVVEGACPQPTPTEVN